MNLLDYNFTSTIKDYDYTKKAIVNMNDVVNSEMFYDMDAEAIFEYLMKKMEIVSFKDYLRRYIYEHSGMEIPFLEVPEDIYVKIIMDSFDAHKCPHSFTPVTTRFRTTVRSWLKKDNVTRNTVFLLGFGLNMTDQDVSDFLTKVLKERDFDFLNKEEVVYWYCYHNNLPYRQAKAYLEYAQRDPGAVDINMNRWKSMMSSPRVYLGSVDNLKIYLDYLTQTQDENAKKQQRLEVFETLYERTRQMIAENYWNDWDRKASDRIDPKDIMPGDIEKILYSGVPFNKEGNMTKMSASLLAKHFEQKRLTRQRIAKILEKKLEVLRYDLITLLFLYYALGVEPDAPEKRYIQFIEEINGILAQAEMADIYPVNPYEAFVLMCLITEYPLDVYEEIWEKSYDDQEG